MLPQSSKPDTERSILGLPDNCLPGLSENVDGDPSGSGLTIGGRMLDETMPATYLPKANHRRNGEH
eukprot:5361058-Prorocentrum_lima.AAC.1